MSRTTGQTSDPRVQQLLHEQDQGLQELEQSVGRIKEIAIAIGQEAQEQNQLLEEFHGDVDRTQGRLRQGIQQVSKILKKTGDTPWCVAIIILIVVVIVLGAIAIVFSQR